MTRQQTRVLSLKWLEQSKEGWLGLNAGQMAEHATRRRKTKSQRLIINPAVLLLP